jgi:hypothetical protein
MVGRVKPPDLIDMIVVSSLDRQTVFCRIEPMATLATIEPDASDR